MSELPPDGPTPLDPRDPRNFAHHYVVRRKGERPRARSFHTTLDCEQIANPPSDSEVVDLSVDAVEILLMTPCGSCVKVVNTSDTEGLMSNVMQTLRDHRISLSSDDIARLVVAELAHAGYRVTRASRKTLPDRPAMSPLEALVDEHAPMSTDEPTESAQASTEPAGEPSRPDPGPVPAVPRAANPEVRAFAPPEPGAAMEVPDEAPPFPED